MAWKHETILLFGMAYFQVRAVSFRGGHWLATSKSQFALLMSVSRNDCLGRNMMGKATNKGFHQ